MIDTSKDQVSPRRLQTAASTDSKTQGAWCMPTPNFTTSGSSPLPDAQTPSAKLIPARSRAQLPLGDKQRMPLTSFQNQEQQSWEEIHVQHQATHRLSLPTAYQNFQRTQEAAGIPRKLERSKPAKCFKYNQPWLTPVSKYSNWFIFVLNWNRTQ